MESVQLDNGNSNEETFLEQSSHPDSPDIDDVCGHPQVNPRLGDEYQVEIPPMITEFAQHQLLKNPAGSEVLLDISHSFLTGLPVLIMWIHEEVTNIEDEQLLFLSNPDHSLKANGTVKSRKSKKNHVDLKEGLNHSIGPLVVGLKLDSREASKPANLGHKLAEKINFEGPCKSRSYPLPGSLGDPWGDADVDAFLLGLYLFRKNFVQVKRFIEKKMMGDILSFYYGVFYKSDKYHRWSNCRKTRSRRSVYGRKIFTGWRLHKFLSRLRPHVPDELQNTLLKVLQSSLVYMFRKQSLK
ncbi:hypothetical protein CFOL_v3_34539 [Cephalotus follicularis]|uniref:DUF7952 domain-containing protein n=1 Tax=Cephalotus follicularis TaxID=3775 RepID=A0A1Q3DF67_CEPFO|nr:hypothetical protein CFOL_v3_34539 [Cephalotus follicularis]